MRRGGRGDWWKMASGLAMLIALQLECGRRDTAAVEAIEGDQPRLLALSLGSLSGRRDGDHVNATLTFKGNDPQDRLVVGLILELGPPIRLGNGTFLIREQGKMVMGKVDATSLTFQAGQSGGMNLGGRFLLLDNSGTTLYRVLLPNTVMNSSYR